MHAPAFTGEQHTRSGLRGFAVVRVEQSPQELLALHREFLIRCLVGVTPQNFACYSALRYPVANPLMWAVAVEEADIGPDVCVRRV